MSDQGSVPPAESAGTAGATGQPAPGSNLPVPASTPAQEGPGPAARAAEIADERPEVAAGAAFGAGFMLAMILRRLAR